MGCRRSARVDEEVHRAGAHVVTIDCARLRHAPTELALERHDRVDARKIVFRELDDELNLALLHPTRVPRGTGKILFFREGPHRWGVGARQAGRHCSARHSRPSRHSFVPRQGEETPRRDWQIRRLDLASGASQNMPREHSRPSHDSPSPTGAKQRMVYGARVDSPATWQCVPGLQSAAPKRSSQRAPSGSSARRQVWSDRRQKRPSRQYDPAHDSPSSRGPSAMHAPS